MLVTRFFEIVHWLVTNELALFGIGLVIGYAWGVYHGSK